MQEKLNKLFNLGLEMKTLYNYHLKLNDKPEITGNLPKVTYRIDPDGKESITFSGCCFSFLNPATKSVTFASSLLDSVVSQAEDEVKNARLNGFNSVKAPIKTQLAPLIINTSKLHKLLWVNICPIHKTPAQSHRSKRSTHCTCYCIEQDIDNGTCSQGKVFIRPENYEKEIVTKQFKRGIPF